MAADEAETVSTLIAAFNGGADEIQRVKALIAEDGEMRPLSAQIEATNYVGPEGLVRFYDDLHTDWNDLELRVYDTRARPGLVVALARLSARGRVSGVELDLPIGIVWELRDGLVQSAQSFSDPDNALRAAGLEDE